MSPSQTKSRKPRHLERNLLRHPTSTFRRAVDWNPKYMTWGYAACAGITLSLAGITVSQPSMWSDWGDILNYGIVYGSVGGAMTMFLNSALSSFIGRRQQGKGAFSSIIAAHAWSRIPLVWSMPLVMLMVVLLGQLHYTAQVSGVVPNRILTLLGYVLYWLLIVGASAWALLLRWRFVGEALGLSGKRAALNIVLVWFMTVAVSAAVGLAWGLARLSSLVAALS